MDRNSRDARRATAVSASISPSLSNALPRRRHRTSLRDSLEEDGPLELPDTSRSGLRDQHVGGKKDRDRADRVDRDRDRDRDRERLLRNKRRRGDGNSNNHRLIHHGGTGNRGEELGMVADETSEESVNNEDEDDYEHLHHQQHTRLSQPPSAVTSSSSMMLNNSRRSYPPSASAMAAEEMIGVSVPRKARSASAKRSHDCWVGGGGTTVSHAGGDQAVRQPLTSPKPNGPKQRLPPKSVPNPVTSSATLDEIEIAEVLYGMMRQPQGPSPKSETSFGGESGKTEVCRDENNKPVPVSNSGSVLPPQNSSSSIPLMSAIAPKRKKPRVIRYDEEIQVQSIYPGRNSPLAAKIEMDSLMKINSSPSMERGKGSRMENGGTYEQDKPQDTPVPLANHGEDVSKMVGLPGLNKREDPGDSKQELLSLKKESDGKTEPKRSCGAPVVENQREEKFQIDLMAPPATRSSPGRDGHVDSPAGADQISIGTAGEEGEKRRTEAKKNEEGGVNERKEEVKREAEGGDSKGVVDLQIDLERRGGGGGMMMMMMMGNGSAGAVSKGNHLPFPIQQQPAPDKSAPTAGPLTFPIPVAGWPGGLPPLGYMPPLPGVVSVDGTAVASAALQPPPLLFSQPRPKRCVTHCYVARNISYHQQMARIPFWPAAAAAAAGPVSLYGAKPCNVSVMPSTDPNGNVSTRSVNAVAEKGQNLGLPGHSGKDKGSQMSSDAQRKPVLLQQTIPPGVPGNILHGPAFIFPLSQQHAPAAATASSIRSGPSKSPNISNTAAAPVAAAGSALAASSAVSPTGAAAAMSFSYPNMPGGETQYLAILQNNSYPFPVPTHMGSAPAYRGTHPQAMPFFNGPFYSSQMLHPSQLPQLQGPGQQNSSSPSMKHLQNHQRPPGSVGNGSRGSLQGFASGKNQPSPLTQMQQPQINQQQPQQVRPSESEFAGGDGPSTDARIPRTNMTTIYGQNFAMPIHAPNFALMSKAPQGGITGANSNNTGEKQQPQLHSQHQGSKQSAVDSLQSQAFALSFGNMDNSASVHALTSIGQGHTVLQSLPEATRQTFQMMTAAVAAQNTQHKKNIRPSDDGSKGGGNDVSNDNDRKPLGGKILTIGGQSIAFSRHDTMDTSVSSVPGGSVVDSSVRTLNLGSSSSRTSASVLPAQASTNPGTPSPQQVQRSQQQQMIQLQKQHQFAAAAAAAARSKTPASSNESAYSEHLGALASAAVKYPSSLSSFPQNFVQGSGSPTQSPQWRGSTRPVICPVPSPLSPATATSPSLKLRPQQPVRVPPGQTHISFANSNSKSGYPSQGQQIPASSQQAPSSPAVVGSPTTSSVSKSTGGSPRTTASSTGNKPGQAASSLQAPQSMSSSQSMPMHKSSPVRSGNVLSILGNSPRTASTGAGGKHKFTQQQQLSKQNLQQAQLFFSHPYVPVPAGHSAGNSASTVSATSAYYMQRCPSEQQQEKVQHLSQGSAPSSSLATLSLCPPTTLSSSGTCDPVKAATVSNLKGSSIQAQGILHASPFTVTQCSGGSHQIIPTGFSFVHAVPNAVQVKQAEQKPPAGE
ncbi:hypothetical protein MLD38_012016 [Melastoma candidum]|uniref:Uncharacterized protein n=1 Tax=Melastoma candidum TaxID=119954 RepID=A0ACB9R4Z8_9MYRT|nr:hypothetical protein MLD38_012016 [Melastoma candidum]